MIFAIKVMYLYICLMSFVAACYYLRRLIMEQKKSSALETENLRFLIREERMKYALAKARNTHLKAQINPHFLFNTLDYIYHNISLENPTAADALVTLSEMMRYAIASENAGQFILLQEEIEQVQNLIYLHQLRKDHALNINLIIDDEVRLVKFIPLVLLTLTENIFKHGNTSHKNDQAVIRILLKDDQLLIETVNAISMKPQMISTGSGLQNIRDRLHYTYGRAVTLRIEKEQGYFKVQLSIPLKRIVNQEH